MIVVFVASGFMVCKLHGPPSIPSYIAGSSPIDACDDVLRTMEEILALLRKNLTKAQTQMKLDADKHRREVDFPLGAWAYVKLQPYRQISVTGQKYHKLSKRFYGPYLIVAKIGVVAYKLALPAQSSSYPQCLSLFTFEAS
jgi:hypothetical protein